MQTHKNYLIYKLTSPSGKVYVGQTSKTLEERITIHNKDRNRAISTKRTLPRFYAAWFKYPIDLWKQEVLITNLSKKEANKIEIKQISLHQSLNEKFGYNMTNGGDGGDTGKNGDINKRKKHSIFLKKLNKNPNFVRNRIQKALKTISANPIKFKTNCKYRKSKLRRGLNHQNNTGVWVVRFNQYATLSAAVLGETISESTILKLCNNCFVPARCTNKYLKKNQTPKECGFYKLSVEGEFCGKI